MKIPVCPLYLILFCFTKTSAAFDGVYDLDSCDISHEFVKAFLTKTGSIELKRKICKTLCYIQNSFHSQVNALGNIKPGMEVTKAHDQIVRIIVILKRWALQIEEGYYMGNKDKKHTGIKQFDNKALYQFGFMANCLDHLHQFYRNSRKTCLASKSLQSNPYSP